jgi:hypothetical protein
VPRVDWAALTAPIDNLRAELPPVAGDGEAQKLQALAAYLSTVRRDLQRNVHPPISPADTTGLEAVLTSITDVLSMDSIRDVLPVSAAGLADTGYGLLDRAAQYKVLALHFFSRQVQAARRGRTSDAVDAEVEAVSERAADLKKDIIDYIDELRRELSQLGP